MRGKQTVKKAIPTHHEKWGWFLALGIILIALGVLAAIYVVPTSVVAAMFIGMFIAAAGIVQIIHAFTVMNWGQFLLWLVAGIIYTAAGVLCIVNPFAFLPILTLLLAVLFIVAGILRMVIGFRVHYINGAAWIIINGIVSTLLGIIIIIQWPLSGFWTFGILISIDLIFQGIGWVAFSCGLKQLGR